MDWEKGAQYWDKCWNPVIGCKPISEGCRNCYAASMAQRFPELQDATGCFLPHAPKAPEAVAEFRTAKKRHKSRLLFLQAIDNLTESDLDAIIAIFERAGK